ncbi:hypothetical protein EUTSA_v10001186mg [Eutrema salsugineum]|uniref:TIR domain-containing protein n=1 Tax=Eutrema salsugineum TaxID=72664 RepID=V4LII3_EUTSA|nr:hypothetical protein EUTSA_v10001186mg [Eutrema salsugineum]
MSVSSSQAGDNRPQVFINYRKEELRKTFIKSLLPELKRGRIKFFIDDNEEKESRWCLDELHKMKKLAEGNKLVVIPVFVNVTTTDVKHFNGEFGKNFREMCKKYVGQKVRKWREAVEYIADIIGEVWDNLG